nr:cationic amino acid transporter 1-like [Ipomoea trifida]GME04672.1 cationic amino acid transporter 1-like [Ipomoea batatas]
MEMKVGWVELILLGMTVVTIAATAALMATDEHQMTLQDAAHAIVLSCFSGLSAVLSNLCNAEFKVAGCSVAYLRWFRPNELVGFIVVGNIFLEYEMGVVVGRSWTYYLTTIYNNTNRSTLTVLPDLIALGVCFNICMTAILIRKAASSPLVNYIASIIYGSAVNFIFCTCIFIKSDPNYNPFHPAINGGAHHAPPGHLVSISAFFIFMVAALALLLHFYHVSGVTTVDNRNKLIAFLLLILGASIAAASSNASWITYSITALAWFFSTLGLSYSVPRARNPSYWSVSMVPWVSSLTIAVNIFVLGSMDKDSLKRWGLWTGLLLPIYFFV